MAKGRFIVVASLTLVLTVGCGDDEPASDVGEELAMSIQVESDAFADGEAIPQRYSCDGANVSPPLSWRDVPADAAALALVVDDPDAPSGTFVHWVVMDIDADSSEVAEGAVPSGGVEARNSAGDAEYFGPCPPSGTHHYRFTVYALDRALGLPAGASLDEALAAIDSHATAQGRVTGIYARW